jgi:hypothetical protein
MKANDQQLGKPGVLYKATQSQIEATPSPIEGMIAYATDTGKIGMYTSAGWSWDIGGGGIDVGIDARALWPASQYNEEFDDNLSASWITINGSSNFTQWVEKSALVMKVDGHTTMQFRGVAKPIPSGYWECYAKVGMAATTRGTTSDWTSAALALYDQNSGKLTMIMNHRNNTNIQINIENWNSPTSWNSAPSSQGETQYFHPYLYIAKKSTGYTYGYGYDGFICPLLIDYNLSSFMTPTHIGFLACCRVVPGRTIMSVHWMRFNML